MLHKKLCEQRGVTTTFTASDGWLWRFGQRHGIRQLTLQGEKLSADRPAAENFIASFEDIIENGQYTFKFLIVTKLAFIINFYLESLWYLVWKSQLMAGNYRRKG